MKTAVHLLTPAFILGPLLAFAQKLNSVDATPASTQPPFTMPVRLEQELLRLSNLSGGKVGICATHIESGKTVAQNGKDPFPMASSYKVAIATQLLTRVDSGSVTLDQLVPITKNDLHPGSGMLSDRFNWPNTPNPAVSLSVRSLLELMLLISDNSATDPFANGPSPRSPERYMTTFFTSEEAR